MIKVIRSPDMEPQCLLLLNRREAGRTQDGKPMYVGHLVSTLEWYVKVWKMLLRFVWRMWKGEMRSENGGVVFEGRPGFVLGSGEREVLEMMEMKGEELMKMWKEKKARFGGVVKDVWKDEEVKRVVGELEECVLDVWVEMLGIEMRGNRGKSVFVCSMACLGLNLRVGSWKELDRCTQVCAAVLTIRKLFVLYGCWLKRKKEVD